MSEANAAEGIIVSGDLFWASKIVETARALGHRVERIAGAEGLDAALSRVGTQLRVVVVDLSLEGVDPEAIVRAVKAAAPDARLAAFGRHTEPALLEAAHRAGFDPVLARSALAARLPDALGEWLAKPGAAPDEQTPPRREA